MLRGSSLDEAVADGLMEHNRPARGDSVAPDPRKTQYELVGDHRMTAVPFDTLKLADRLQAGGFSADQSRAVSAALVDAASGAEIATKQDLASLAARTDLLATKPELQAGLAELKAELKAELQSGLAEVKADLLTTKADLKAGLAQTKAEILAAKTDILKWVMSAIGVQTAAILGAVTVLVRLAH